ncbi:hypothetical protein CCB80_03150 [Armatimonadetes bacterium Uphvl-Ar1]|nr:hypothetical protein CCB80_03150 [Armatimonadetes bacterium Uphvl-Ar1]
MFAGMASDIQSMTPSEKRAYLRTPMGKVFAFDLFLEAGIAGVRDLFGVHPNTARTAVKDGRRIVKEQIETASAPKQQEAS